MPPLGAGLVGSSNAPFRVWKNTALDGGLSLSEKQQRLRPKLEFPDSQVYRFRSHVCCYSHLYFSFHFSTISPFYFLRCGDTSEDLELVKSDVRPHARFPILHLVLSLNMIVSSVIHCKAQSQEERGPRVCQVEPRPGFPIVLDIQTLLEVTGHWEQRGW